MTIYAQVRAFLIANPDKVFTPCEIHDKSGLDCKRALVSWACSTMFARGVLIRSYAGRSPQYRMNPEWSPRERVEGETQNERNRIYRARWNAKRAAQGLPPYLRPVEVERKKRTQEHREAFAKVKAQREAEKAARKATLTKERKSKLIAVVSKNAEKRSIKPAPKPTKIAPAKPAQTVEDFIASGGKIERLPRGATSGRLAA